MAGDSASVRLLLINQVDVNAFNKITLPTIAQYVAEPEAAAALMTSPNFNWTAKDQPSPLHLAV